MRIEQNEFQQQGIIQNYTKHGRLGELYWFVQMVKPPLNNGQRRRMSPADVAAYNAARISTASYPLNYMPVIPVAPCPVTSRIDADLLAFFFSLYNQGITFKPALATQNDIDREENCYIYPDQLESLQPQYDHICPHCGGISPSAICPVCAPRPAPVLLYDGTHTHVGMGRNAAPQCGCSAVIADRMEPTPARLKVLAPSLCLSCFDLG